MEDTQKVSFDPNTLIYRLSDLPGFNLQVSKIPEDELPEGLNKEESYLVPVLIGQALKDQPENQMLRQRVINTIVDNEAILVEAVGHKWFKVIVKQDLI